MPAFYAAFPLPSFPPAPTPPPSTADAHVHVVVLLLQHIRIYLNAFFSTVGH